MDKITVDQILRSWAAWLRLLHTIVGGAVDDQGATGSSIPYVWPMKRCFRGYSIDARYVAEGINLFRHDKILLGNVVIDHQLCTTKWERLRKRIFSTK